ncbi:ABC transporter ATP-binding protein [Bacillus sp. SCS-151]|uniref:ABC transporter ATP-binding protein n=1 Tax=Nanhaiella sioensis TaxID=3115293 RepID=UPI00397B8241
MAQVLKHIVNSCSQSVGKIHGKDEKMETEYEIVNVSKQFKKGKVKANDQISFNVYRGEILGLLGPNGAGKSTLIKQMVGHLKPSSGRINFRGLDVTHHSKMIAQNVSYYSQDPNALTSLRLWEVLYFTGRLRGMKKKEALAQTEFLLNRFDLYDLKNKLLKDVSGGQKRILGIGTALIGESSVLIFDEPTNELDPKKRRLVWDLIKERNQQGSTIILVTHNVLEAEHVVDRVAVVNHGKLLNIDHISVMKQRVDQRLKCEITTHIGRSKEVIQFLSQYGQPIRTGENRVRLLVAKKEAGAVIDSLAKASSLPIYEYSLVPPNLEDVYFHIDDDSEEKIHTEEGLVS